MLFATGPSGFIGREGLRWDEPRTMVDVEQTVEANGKLYHLRGCGQVDDAGRSYYILNQK
jgi:hypothetical protein